MNTDLFVNADRKHWLMRGDCLERMKEIPDGSVDSIVTDPPYGLSFMGKKWDYDVPSVAIWMECLRVLKPGGHLLAFAGTRTQHRMACRIEDAGFEIRDMIAWVYGSGFPKSLDVSKAIDKAAGAEREVIEQVRVKGGGMEHVNRTNAAAHAYRPDGYQKGENVLDITTPATDAAKQWDGWGTALKPAWENIGCYQKPLTVVGYCASMVSNLTERINTCRQNASGAAKSSEPSQAGLLEARTDSVPASAATRREDCHANGTRTGGVDGTRLEADTSASPSLQDDTALSTILSWRNTLAAVCKAANRSTISTAFETTIDWRTLSFCLSPSMLESTLQGAFLPSGASADALRAARFSTACFACLNIILALSAAAPAMSPEANSCRDVGAKPALEPITVARKPFDTTVAENVQAFGTGALNIDGCRVETDDEITNHSRGSDSAISKGKYGDSKAQETHQTSGQAVGRWPANFIHDGSEEVLELFPETKTGDTHPIPYTNTSGKNVFGTQTGTKRAMKGDSGSAARFFYCAKTSKTDRGEGNTHPTVKPTTLMRYLCRLVTPPCGIVLDPFLGSGSTGKACAYEGFRFLGIERDEAYFDLAAERVIDAYEKAAKEKTSPISTRNHVENAV